MPVHKVGRLWKFKLAEVDDWVRGGGITDNHALPNKQYLEER